MVMEQEMYMSPQKTSSQEKTMYSKQVLTTVPTGNLSK